MSDLPHIEHDAESVELLVHELRGPLTVISGYAQLLRRPLDDDERTRTADALARAVGRLSSLLDEFAAGRGPTCPAPLDLEHVALSDLVARVAFDTEAATGRSVQVSVEGEPCVLADEARLERALSNLLRNADKYSPGGAPVYLSASVAGADALLVVADEGPGIPVDDRERVLKRFERLERDAEQPGTGLGLAIVREIVEAHGGSITVSDRVGGGARMEVRLPLCAAEAAASSVAKPA